jgi:hypothetical protein
MGLTLILKKIVLKYGIRVIHSVIQYEYLFDRGMQQSGHIIGQPEGGIIFTLFEKNDSFTPDAGEFRQFLLRKIVLSAIFLNPGPHNIPFV